MKKPKKKPTLKETTPRGATSVVLHPKTIKLLNKGHPWILKDSFTDEFPKRDQLLLGKNRGEAPSYQFIHDPLHSKIKGRVWKSHPPFDNNTQDFKKTLDTRLDEAFQKRKESHLFEQRQNIYLCYGEADSLPGLFVLKLGPHLVISCTTSFWKKYFSQIVGKTSSLLHSTVKYVWIQYRGQKPQHDENYKPYGRTVPWNEVPEEDCWITEFDLQYKISISQHKDLGIYTDMASIRKTLNPLFLDKLNVLNLFAYTGAFSQLALKNNANKVVSVDQSKQNGDWLIQNIEKNQFSSHKLVINSVEKALTDLSRHSEFFNVIVCDPPPLMSIANKTLNSSQFYDIYLKLLIQILDPKNGKLIIFINTHHVKESMFLKDMETRMKPFPKIQIKTKLQQGEDCPTYSQFPEGKSIKGIIISYKDSNND
ncbi:class I SAM-dependent methyltransferase [Bacteriovoracaceae bacterium]|nr:class I SAM-dependent methyltransferase [Bacteriovoracaceae bacterium]